MTPGFSLVRLCYYGILPVVGTVSLEIAAHRALNWTFDPLMVRQLIWAAPILLLCYAAQLAYGLKTHRPLIVTMA